MNDTDCKRFFDFLTEPPPNKKGAQLPPSPGSVFEVVDVTSEETYYTMGIWPTLKAAMDALESCGDNPPGEDFDEDSRSVEVREREVGVIDWSGVGRVVATVQWVQNWDYESPDYRQWRRVKTPNTKAEG